MSHLATTAFPAATAELKLSGPGNFKPWSKSLKQQLMTNYGATGQNLLALLDHNIESPLPFRNKPPGARPTVFDVRLNAVTGLPVASGDLQFPRDPHPPVFEPKKNPADPLEPPVPRKPTREETFEMPLTNGARESFEKADAKYEQLLKLYSDEALTHRKDDDLALSFMISTISASAYSILQTNPEMKTINDDPSFFYRARNFLKIINRQFATGNSSHITNNLLTLLNLRHENGSFADHLDDFKDRWNQLSISLEDPNNPGYIKSGDIHFTLLLNSLNRRSTPTMQAINNYFIAHPEANSLDPHALTKLLIDQHLGNLADHSFADPISEQGSALLSTPSRRPPYGVGDPNRSDHCKICYEKTKGKTKTIGPNVYTGPFKFYHATCHRLDRETKGKAKTAAALLSKADATSPTTATDTTLSIYMAGLLAGQQQAAQQQDGFSVMSQATTQP